MTRSEIQSLIWFTIKNICIISLVLFLLFICMCGGVLGITIVLQLIGVPPQIASGIAIVIIISSALAILVTIIKIECTPKYPNHT